MIDGLNLNFDSGLLAGANVQFGGQEGSAFTAIDGVRDVFFVSPGGGSVIQNFNINEDVIAIVSADQPLTFLDIVNPFRPDFFTVAPGTSANQEDGRGIIDTDNGAEVRIPYRSIRYGFLTVEGVSAADLANSPESFAIFSLGNQVIDGNELTFDAARLAGVPPAISAFYFAQVQGAIADSVIGIQQPEGLQTYLSSIGQGIAAPEGASAEAAAVAATNTALTLLFSDRDNPLSPTFTPSGGTATAKVPFSTRVFDAQLASGLAEIDGSAESIAAGVAYGREVAQTLYALRANDGVFRNADGTPINRAALNTLYQNGIEPNDALNEISYRGLTDGTRRLLNDGTVGFLSDGELLVNTAAPINVFAVDGTQTTTSVAFTTPGAWRRAEDTYNAAGIPNALASPEIANINQTYILPDTRFFNDNVLPPPALDSARNVNSVAQVALYGDIRDLPNYNGGNGEVTVVNLSVTENGTTRVIGNAVVGTAFNDTTVGGNTFTRFGLEGPGGIGTTSEERTIIAHIFANTDGAYGPNYTWQKVAQQLVINNNSSLLESAVVFGTLDLGFADTFANTWDIKWDEDYFWRPTSAIRNAEQIDATAFLDDNTWTPREVTPQHPCHPSGTSVSAGFASIILASFYGNEQTFTIGADVHPASERLRTALVSVNGDDLVGGVPIESITRTYTSLSDAADEGRASRVYAGGHFEFATENGIQFGESAAAYILRFNPYVVNEAQAQSNANFPILSVVGTPNPSGPILPNPPDGEFEPV